MGLRVVTAGFDPDPDDLADQEAWAEFQRAFAIAGEDHQRILQALIPKLAALSERGDSVEALRLIAAIRTIIDRQDESSH